MKAAVLIPTLNRLGYLKESLESARGQTYRDLEIVVSDDGSKDGSVDYIRDIAARDSRVRLAPPNPQPGLFGNINYLLGQHHGDVFGILADDDRWRPAFIERVIEPLRNQPGVAAAFCDHWIIDAAGRVLAKASEGNSRDYGRAALPPGVVADPVACALKRSMCMGFSLYRSAVFRNEPFDAACGGAADVDYALRAAKLGQLYFVKERLADYRAHPATATATRAEFMLRGFVHALAKHRFKEARHERLRRCLLRAQLRHLALFLSAHDRASYWRVIGDYRAARGCPAAPRIMLSLGLALLPLPAAQRAKAFLQRLRRGTLDSSGS